jgi:succinate dehydrogenase flavin-adding protein (antitoxin of CptAB toxin-antitoxin module)
MNQDQLEKIHLKRLKFASEAYRDHKAIFTEQIFDDETQRLIDEPIEGYIAWPAFRDEFLKDWINNRRPIDEKEDQVMIDKLADEALNELMDTGASVDLGAVVLQVEEIEQVVADADSATIMLDTLEVADADSATIMLDTLEVASVSESEVPVDVPEEGDEEDVPLPLEEAEAITIPVDEATAAPKRRGRPPGSGKPKAEKVAKVPKEKVPKVPKVPTVRAAKKKVAKKVAAKKADGGSKAEKARGIIAKFGPRGRKWERKDILEKLVSQLGVGPAYASSLYQSCR